MSDPRGTERSATHLTIKTQKGSKREELPTDKAIVADHLSKIFYTTKGVIRRAKKPVVAVKVIAVTVD